MSLRLPRIRRSVLIVLAVLVALPVAGALYQTLSVRREAGRFPPPGRMVDVGGRRLHLLCTGEGDPTVVFVSSGFGTSVSSEGARAEISARTRVCSYDRMGTGWSDPGPSEITAGLLAEDLRVLLDRAGLGPPYILVPASIGGLTAELFARRYPERVAGLVFVDAGHTEMIERVTTALSPTEMKGATAALCLGRTAARLGILRLLDPFDLRREGEAAARTIALLYRVEPMATLCAMARGIPKTLEEVREAPPFAPDIPLTVLSHDRPTRLLPPAFASLARVQALLSEWNPLQQRLARRSSRGTWRMVPGSDHLIGSSRPHAVASAVLEMLEEIRRHPISP